MNYIIVGVNGRPSMEDMFATYDFQEAVILLTYLRNKATGKTFWRSMTPGSDWCKNPVPTFNEHDKVIMWGTRIPLDFGEAIVYNHTDVSVNASNKKKAREIFEEKNIAAPKLVHHDELHMTSYPVIIRKDKHRAGIGFYIANTDTEALKIIKEMGDDNYYISEIYPKTAEFRVHCASGKALLVKQKPTPEDKSIIAWNFHQNELPWSTIDRKDYNFDMITLALNAIEAVGIDYGAVDIMSYPDKDGYPEHVVAEINTAPSYTPYLISKYGAYFEKLFRTKGKLKPWDYKEFKKGPSLAWKNKQLQE